MSSLPIWPQNSFIHKDYTKDQLGFYMDQKELTIDSKGLKMVFRSKISVFWLTWEVPPSLPMETLAKNLCLILGYPRPPPSCTDKIWFESFPYLLKEYAYSNPLLLSVTSLSPPFTVFWVKGPQGPLTPSHPSKLPISPSPVYSHLPYHSPSHPTTWQRIHRK